MKSNFREIVEERKKFHIKIDEMYLQMLNDINNKIKDLDNLEITFRKDFLKACALDISGEVVRIFFDAADYNITADQVFRRILEFKYEDEYDPLSEEIARRKGMLNLSNSQESIENLKDELGEAERLFLKQEVESSNGKTRKEYVDKKLIQEGKKEYRREKERKGEYEDEVGTAKEKLEVDHIQPLATSRVYTNYFKEDGVDRIKEFYNSEDNFSLFGKTANQCKGDAKVLDKDGNDITHRATPEQMTEAIVKKLEGGKNRKNETTKKLQDEGILDKNGKIYPHIKRKMEKDLRKSQNKESVVILKNTDYKKVGKDAAKETAKQIHKIIAGQLIYYIVPPIIYEIKIGLESNKDSDSILEKLSKSSDRIIDYVLKKKTEIFIQIADKSLKKILKNLFDVIINVVKATIKRILKIARQLIITVIDAIKILFDKNKTFAEKMDAILQLVAALIVSIVCEILFEYIEKQFGIPEMFLMPLQMITTIIVSNFVMLSLKKLDLFNARDGFKKEKIIEIFKEEREKNDRLFKEALNSTNEKIEAMFYELKEELKGIKENLAKKNLFENTVQEKLERQFEIFGQDVSFQEDWEKFLGKV